MLRCLLKIGLYSSKILSWPIFFNSLGCLFFKEYENKLFILSFGKYRLRPNKFRSDELTFTLPHISIIDDVKSSIIVI